MTEVDVAILGAGPAGMSAAMAARECKRSVLVLDEQAAPGGQIYRNVLHARTAQVGVLGGDYAAGRSLAQAFSACGAQHVHGARVWEVTRERVIRFVADAHAHAHVHADADADAGVHEVQAKAVVLANGAVERAMPIPGWTLPGVMTAGAAQILLKSADLLPASGAVLAGCGPLLYQLADQYLRAGVSLRAIVDTTPWSAYWKALPLLPGALRDWRLLAKGMSLLQRVRGSKVQVFRGGAALEIEGADRACAIRFESGGRSHRIATPLVLLHHGIVPNTQVTRSLRAPHVWDETQACFRPVVDVNGKLEGVEGIYVAGDAAGIMGAVAAAESGRVAGLSAAGMQASTRTLQRLRAARPFVDVLYAPPLAARLPRDEVIVCRCEEVTAGEIRAHVRNGCVGPNQLKAFARCGMGPCQGQQCALTVCELIAAERNISCAEVGLQRVRPPLKPITLGQLGGVKPS